MLIASKAKTKIPAKWRQKNFIFPSKPLNCKKWVVPQRVIAAKALDEIAHLVEFSNSAGTSCCVCVCLSISFMCLCVCVSVSLLELVVPLVEVDVENNHRASRQASHQESRREKINFFAFSKLTQNIFLLLVVRESETSDAWVTGWESIEQGEVESPPYLRGKRSKLGEHETWIRISRNH